MFDTATGITEGIRDERAAMRERSMDWRQRRLQNKVEALHEELDREREARRALTDAMGGGSGRKRGRGLLRILLIGGGAYVLGTRAGRERYDQMTGWVRGMRDRAVSTGKAVQDEAVQTAGQVRDVAVDTARSVGDDVKTTAAQVRDDASKGARAVSEETGDAVQRLRKELAPTSDV
jgi:hypothetical protein